MAVSRISVPSLCRVLFLGLLLLAPLARGSVKGWSVAALHLWLVVLIGLYVGHWLWTGRVKMRRTVLDLPLLVLSVGVLVAAFFSPLPTLSCQALFLFGDYLAVYFLTVQLFRSRGEIRLLLTTLLVLGVVLALIGFVKLSEPSLLSWWNYEELHYPVVFLSGPYGNHNHLAGALELLLPLGAGLVLMGYRPEHRSLLLSCGAVMALALLLSQSRGGWVGGLAGIILIGGFFMGQGQGLKKITATAVVFALLLLAGVVIVSTPTAERLHTISYGEGETSLSSRMIAWQGVLQMIKAQPWLGSGPGTFATIFPQYQPPGFDMRFDMAHNDYLQFLAEMGLGLIPFWLWAGWLLFRRGWRRLAGQSRLVKGYVLGGLAGIVAILVHSLVDFNLHIPANAVLFMVVVAMVAGPDPEINASDQVV